MQISTEIIQQLRQATGMGMMDCKKALEESKGDYEKALENLRKRGQKIAQNKQDRVMKSGLIDAYIHNGGKVGSIVKITCETDFVARSDEFKNFVHDVAMQVAATNAQYLKPEDIPAEILEKEKEIYLEQMKDEKKPAEIKEKILKGKLEKYFQEVCLLNLIFIKDDKITIGQMLTEKIGKIGENIEIKSFIRFSL